MMDNTNDLRDLLYKKMYKEQEQFIEKLKLSTPEEIISSSYEKVMRDDILMAVGDNNCLNDKQMKELLKIDYPLSACYNEWMDTDCSHMEMLQDTISDFADELIKENEPEQKKPHKKKYEPER